MIVTLNEKQIKDFYDGQNIDSFNTKEQVIELLNNTCIIQDGVVYCKEPVATKAEIDEQTICTFDDISKNTIIKMWENKVN